MRCAKRSWKCARVVKPVTTSRPCTDAQRTVKTSWDTTTTLIWENALDAGLETVTSATIALAAQNALPDTGSQTTSNVYGAPRTALHAHITISARHASLDIS